MTYPRRSVANQKFFAVILSIILISIAQNTQAGIFVLDRTTGIVTEYSPGLGKKASHQIPKDLFFSKATSEFGQRSGGLLVSSSGNIFYFNDALAPDNRTIVRKLWYSTDSKEYRAEISMEKQCFPATCFASDVFSTPALDANENAFYWWANHVADYKEGEPGRVKTDFYLYRGGFAPDGRLTMERVAAFPFAECECTTGVCEESCPLGEVQSEKGGITDFIDVEHTVHGQLDTRVEGRTYFSKKDGKWGRTEVNLKLKRPFLRTEYDAGCCGWANESSDRLILVDGVKETVIYDEWARFDNRDYDISFFPANAQLSPDLKRAAYTVTTDPFSADQFRKDGTVRLSSDGKDNPQALKRIGQLIETLPFVEVTPLDGKVGAVTIKKAEFAGWIDSSKMLILKDGHLSAYDVTTRALIGSAIVAASVDDVFVR